LWFLVGVVGVDEEARRKGGREKEEEEEEEIYRSSAFRVASQNCSSVSNLRAAKIGNEAMNHGEGGDESWAKAFEIVCARGIFCPATIPGVVIHKHACLHIFHPILC